MRVLLTGATGFLGGHILDVLREAGHEVHAVVREAGRGARLEARGATLFEASLVDGRGLDRAIDGVEAVIHCAGGGQVDRADRGVFFQQNAGITEVLRDALIRAGVSLRRFVHASSLAASPGPGLAPRSWYGEAKQAAEAIVCAERARWPVTVVRLPALYGPEDTRWLTLFRAVSRGIAPVPSGGGRVSMLFATDAARAMVAPLAAAHASGRIYAPDDGGTYSQAEIARAVARAVDHRVTVVPIPSTMLWMAAAGAELAGRLGARKVFLSRDKVRDLLGGAIGTDRSTMTDELGWRPAFGLDEGLARTARWYRDQGLLPRASYTGG